MPRTLAPDLSGGGWGEAPRCRALPAAGACGAVEQGQLGREPGQSASPPRWRPEVHPAWGRLLAQQVRRPRRGEEQGPRRWWPEDPGPRERDPGCFPGKCCPATCREAPCTVLPPPPASRVAAASPSGQELCGGWGHCWAASPVCDPPFSLAGWRGPEGRPAGQGPGPSSPPQRAPAPSGNARTTEVPLTP